MNTVVTKGVDPLITKDVTAFMDGPKVQFDASISLYRCLWVLFKKNYINFHTDLCYKKNFTTPKQYQTDLDHQKNALKAAEKTSKKVMIKNN